HYTIRFAPYGINSGVPITSPPGGAWEIDLADGQNLTQRDFLTPGNGETVVWGTVFVDANRNGTRDPGEGPAQGQRFYLDYNGNRLPDGSEPSAVTASDGTYGFINVSSAAYDVRRIEVAGSMQTAPPGRGGQHITVSAGSVVET